MATCDRRVALTATAVSWDQWYLGSRLHHMLHSMRLPHHCS